MIGNRIPIEYFITKGKGQSDYGSEGFPYEGGSYDAALTDAGISQVNIMTYTSLIPPDAIEVSQKEGKSRLSFGSVMESILSIMNGQKGQQVIAALLITKIYDKKLNLLGSFVIEYGGFHNDVGKAQSLLFHQLVNMIKNRRLGCLKMENLKMNHLIQTDAGYFVEPFKFIREHQKINKKYGTVIVAICFTMFDHNRLHNG